ncbi:MAG TPA: DUF305 domain-containing protein [Acetobacteraceae bacterium]|nr:DUF305 domain-containing protein [Acetobacteraceae bacterium]
MRLAGFLVLASAGAAMAQPMANMPGMAAPAPGSAAATRHIPGLAYVPLHDSTKAFKDAMKPMMSGMAAPYTGDADHDFVTHMMAHHQGAIDMCQVELKYGSDAKIKALCDRIITAQTSEIHLMQAWLAKHPAKKMGANIPSNIQWK